MSKKALRKITPSQKYDFLSVAVDITHSDRQTQVFPTHKYNLKPNAKIDEKCESLIHPKCAIEVYHCLFCKFENATRSVMKDHYYFSHVNDLQAIEGTHLCRKIDRLITNGEKSFVISYTF